VTAKDRTEVRLKPDTTTESARRGWSKPHTTTVWVAFARAANALFFLLTSTYCLLTYSSFAYQQFIRPRMVASLSSFVAFHHLWHWVFLALTVITLLPEWRTARGRMLAWTYVASMAAVGVWILYRPVLPSVENDAAGLWLACAFLVPPVWLALYDHLAAAAPHEKATVDTNRVVISAALGACVVWAASIASAPLRLDDLGDYTTTTASLVFGAVVSLAVHVGLFTIAGLTAALLLGSARRLGASGAGQYWIVAAITAGIALVTMKTLVFESLSFTGTPAWIVAAESAVAFTLTWSAIARRLGSRSARAFNAIDTWVAPVPGSGSTRGAATATLVVNAGFVLVLRRVEMFDWNFLVQNLCVLATWLLTCGLVYALVSRRQSVRDGRPAAVASLAVVAVAGFGAGGTVESSLPGSQQFVPEFVLDAYATVDPSYRLIRQMLATEPPGSRAFFDDLAGNSLIQHIDVQPIDVDFVQPLHKAATRPPNIFLFVVDSLRRDYLTPYNPTVTFTPAIDQFSRESFAFRRAFTRYGGTGLSMPAMWAGSMILHKEYVLPFTRMNALEKLIEANDYHVMMSMDHITAQIVKPGFSNDELDKGRDEMQYDFCATLEELQQKLDRRPDNSRPVFAHTRSLNLHISKLTERVGAPDPAFGGFQVPAAAAVKRMDGCFGRFIGFLKQRGLYDDSIVILTSDHGDALGEAKRWGHAYTLFPEIVRTPLMIHVPARLQRQLVADLDAPSFSTDITPSLYALLGYGVDQREWPLGRSLFTRSDAAAPAAEVEGAIVASSYGPVYGIIGNRGRSLYIADGVNARDYAYDISGLKPIRVGVTPRMRADGRTLIHDRLATLAALYRFTPSR
jgi:hypothetical protein